MTNSSTGGSDFVCCSFSIPSHSRVSPARDSGRDHRHRDGCPSPRVFRCGRPGPLYPRAGSLAAGVLGDWRREVYTVRREGRPLGSPCRRPGPSRVYPTGGSFSEVGTFARLPGPGYRTRVSGPKTGDVHVVVPLTWRRRLPPTLLGLGGRIPTLSRHHGAEKMALDGESRRAPTGGAWAERYPHLSSGDDGYSTTP